MRYLLFLIAVISQVVFAKPSEAIFGGGCFWCVEADFDKVPGVIQTTSGYDGGTERNPDYSLVSSDKTAYVEVVRVVYDSDKVTYKQLLDFYWHHIDPTVQNQQFCDIGKQYRSVIFYLNDDQKKTALASIDELKKRFPSVYTEVIPSTTFYPAEDYHQDYYQKNPIRYKYYRYNCGRDARIKEIWNEKSR